MTEYAENLGKGFPKGRTVQEFAAKTRKAGRMFPYTMQDIADAIGKSLQTVRRDKGNGLFDPRDLGSLAEYVTDQKRKKKHKTPADEKRAA